MQGLNSYCPTDILESHQYLPVPPPNSAYLGLSMPDIAKCSVSKFGGIFLEFYKKGSVLHYLWTDPEGVEDN